MYSLTGYRLVILFSPKGETESLFLTKLKNYRRPLVAGYSPSVYKEYLSRKLKTTESPACAASVDHEK